MTRKHGVRGSPRHVAALESVPSRRLGVALAVAAPTATSAQSELLGWVNPTLGKQIPGANFGGVYYPAEKVVGQGTDFQRTEQTFSLSLPVFQNPRDEWIATANVALQDYDTHAVLPDTRERFPDELWDVKIGTAYRHLFENGWIGGIGVSVGSPSDQPFASWDEMFLRAIAMLRMPRGEHDAWLFSLIYGTDTELPGGLPGGIPIPGIAYVYVPSERFKAVVGFPFTSVEFQPLEKLTLEAQYFPIRRIRARITYRPFLPLRLYLGFDWDNDHYFRADRADKDDQLFYYEKRLTAGVRFDLRHVGFVLAGGYAFDRLFFEGQDYSDRHKNRLDIEAGPFVSGRISLRF